MYGNVIRLLHPAEDAEMVYIVPDEIVLGKGK